MAKVRIQAGSKAEKTKGTNNRKHSEGTLNILSRIYRKEGLIGWYKVGLCFFVDHNMILTPLSLGYERTAHQGSAFSSNFVYDPGPIQTIHPDPYDRVGAVDRRYTFVTN
jgi:hypothetical protein